MKTSLLLTTLFISACFFDSAEKDYDRAEKALNKKDYVAAIGLFEKVVKRQNSQPIALKAAFHVAEISLFHLKDFQKALKYNKYIVLHSSSEEERFRAQKKVSKIVFENLSDYQRAILEYSRLIEITPDEKARLKFRKQMAKSYYFLNQFYQAETEVDSLIALKPERSFLYDLLLLKGNIKLATKKIDEAIEIYSDLLDRFPQRAAKDNVVLHLAVCYEEKKDFTRAIEVLDELRGESETPTFFDQRILNLRERQRHLPGARGLRK